MPAIGRDSQNVSTRSIAWEVACNDTGVPASGRGDPQSSSSEREMKVLEAALSVDVLHVHSWGHVKTTIHLPAILSDCRTNSTLYNKAVE